LINSITTTENPEASKPRPESAPAAIAPTAARAPALPSAGMVTVVKHPVAQHALTMLRNKLTPPHQFRTSSNQLLVALMQEATRTLPTRAETVPTEKETAMGHVLSKPLVFLTIARHGLGLAHRMAEFFPDLLVGTISYDPATSGPHSDARLHLPNAPALGDVRVIVFDPIVATGTSASRAVRLVRRVGAKDVALVNFVVSASGLETIQSRAPELQIWTAAINGKLDPKRGPMPGVGDFAARMFG
jgi:uracil phosphoribosyltransferase